MKKSVWYFYDDDDDDGNDAGDCGLFCIFVQPICFLHFTKSSLEEYFSIQYYLRYLYHTLSLYSLKIFLGSNINTTIITTDGKIALFAIFI